MGFDEAFQFTRFAGMVICKCGTHSVGYLTKGWHTASDVLVRGDDAEFLLNRAGWRFSLLKRNSQPDLAALQFTGGGGLSITA